MKKFLTFILILAMILSVSSVALAAETPVSNQTDLNTAITNAGDNDVIIINTADTYKLPGFSNKTLTIKANVDGVVIDNGGAVALHDSKVTFENITFDYYPNVNYTGLQHVNSVTYNKCTINGQVFLYGNKEIFNNCTFNQNSADAYNVWTYGAKEVEFNGCTFNCAGKSVLVYNEGGPATKLTVTDTDFVASSSVDGKAAIEIDTTAPKKPGAMDGTEIIIDNETTDTGFAAGSISGKTLWNDKMNQDNLVVKVADKQVWPVVVAQIGDTKYTSLQAAIDAAFNGTDSDVTITFLTDITENVIVTQREGLNLTIDGNSKKMANGSIEICGQARHTGAETLTIKNIVFDIDGAGIDCIHCNKTTENERYAHNVTVEKCTFDFEGVTSGAAVAARFRQCYDIAIVDCEVNGGHSLLQSINSHGVEVKETKISGCEEGINLNNSTDVTIADCDIDVTGYGVRGGEKYSATGNVTIKGTSIKAKRPIIMRWQATKDAYTLNIEDEGNALTPAIGEEPIHVTQGDDDNYDNTNLKQVGGIVAWNKDTNTYYTGWRAAIADAKPGETVYPVKNGDPIEDGAVTIPKPSSGSGISVKYNGGNSFSTSNPSVPTGVEIDGVPVTFNGTGSNFSVGCISSDAKWVTVRWNSTSVTTNFTPDGLVECTTVSIPKTGDMSFWAAVAAFFGF